MQLHLKKFDISTIQDNKVCVLLGKRDTGKSFLVRDLLYYHRDIPIGTVVSATECANKFYSDMIPDIFIHEKPDPEIVANAMKRQSKLRHRMRKEVKRTGRCDIDDRAFLILDDCLADGKRWIRHDAVQGAFLNGRHFNLLVVITLQYPMGLPPMLRGNIDYVFILRDNLISNRKRIYDNYAGMFPSFDCFCQTMNQTTNDYEMLVINNNCKSNKLEDQVFWYKAQQHEPFRIGAQYFWDMCDNNTDGEEDDERELDKNAMQKASRGPVVSVIKNS
ncbi:hypothetical protein TSOC_013776 [Tetrabaena socialis]|uniref:Uncharacterized protein n=1 Tax=Tetrabaena socialis TaxID=47790 RepID=A0A2J7ZJF5_9CHLO|nr:hypothetical protein TSOC_013776 [Tetrabaena socialis]|eukprot:PNH00398.1 hypothetical protein TSOC_013776 [Tetrabaena socialis]